MKLASLRSAAARVQAAAASLQGGFGEAFEVRAEGSCTELG